MSMDRSLRGASGLSRHRNVLTRAERIEKMAGEGKWTEGKSSVMHLPKFGHRKMALAKAEKKTDDAAAATPAAGGAAAAKPAAGAAAAKPAAGAAAKPAAGAAKPAAKK
ncbi:MAG: small basic protein [Tepidisphaeraceae bacterium]